MNAYVIALKGLLTVLMLWGLTGPTYAGAPTVTTTSDCNNDATITVSGNATGFNNDLVKLELFVRRYDSEDECTREVNETETKIHTRDWSAPGVSQGSATKTVTCTSCKWYRAWARATDNQGGQTVSGVTTCCHCETLGQVPTLTEWGLIIFGVLLLGFITWVFLRRRKTAVSFQ